MRKTNNGRSSAGILLPAVPVGLLTALILMLIGAVLVHRESIREEQIALFAAAFLAVGCAAAAALAAGRAAVFRFRWGFGAGMLVFLVLLFVGAALLDQPARAARVLRSLFCAAAASALGAAAGTRGKKR